MKPSPLPHHALPHGFVRLGRRISTCALAACLLLLLQSPTLSAAEAASAPHRNVLVLLSYHQGYAWTDSEVRGILEVFDKGEAETDIDFQYMDTKRHAPEAISRPFAGLLQAILAGAPPDVVILCDDNALDFFLEWRNVLFPEIPAVFCGINDLRPERLRYVHNVTGVTEDFDLRGTIDIALKLHPGVRKIVSVSDGTPSSRANLERLRALRPEYESRGIRFEELADLPEKRLKAELARLGEDSLILHLNYFRSPDGHIYTPQESIRLVAQAASVPIYSCWDWYLGQGIVGGRLTSGLVQGRAAAGLARRILAGEHAEDIPVLRESPNSWMFDAMQLERFHIDESKLPPGSVIVNRHPNFFQRHRGLVISTITTGLLLAGVILLLGLNVLARKRAERELKDSEQRYRALYEEAAVGILIFDEQLRILDANPLLHRSLGYESDTLRGRLLTEFLHSEDLSLLPQTMGTLLRGETVRVEQRLRRADGSFLSFDFSARRLGPGFVQGVCSDVTARVSVEQELQRAKEYAESTSRAKSAFLANMSHELRTPLTTTQGMLELLRAKQPREDQARYIQHALDACQGLTLLLGDILDLSKVEAGRVDLQHERFSLGELLAAIRLNHQDPAAKRGLRFDVRVQPNLPEALLGDPARLRQVLINLVGNAVKYTDKGSVTLSVERLTPLAPGEERLLFTIADTGIGIPDDLLPVMFDAFTQAENTDSRRYQGAGLGLQIVKRLVGLMGGSLCISSQPGQGTEAYVCLRLDRAED